MRRWKAIVSVLVLAVWSACTVHCAIESLSRAGGVPCCNDERGQSDQVPSAPGQCVCSAIQAGGYVSQESALEIPLPLDDLCFFDVSPQDRDSLIGPGIGEVNLSPPKLVRSWQFCFRAALPARAPSLVS